MDQNIAEMVSTATIAIGLFGIVVCMMQSKHPRVSQSFALFLAAVAVNNLPDAFIRMTEAMESDYVKPVDHLLWLSSALSMAPLFWIYVYTLTSTAERRPPRLYRHFLLSILAALAGVIILVSPQDVRVAMFSETYVPYTGWAIPLVAVVVLLELALYPQMAVYLILIVRRMMRYRLKLRDVYASTENYELRWIYIIAVLALLFWLVRTLLLILAFDPEQTGAPPAFIILASLAGFALFATLTLWGLRQAPPLVPDIAPDPSQDIPGTQPSDQQGEKYEKSALSAEASARITRKLRVAMETDHLHRDPNLSLWVLARHIGASPNYISQTLNEVIGESFFDFVNRYRIEEAKTLLSSSNDTVLAITYDVGFNARSSFYNAFKRVTGETPSHYRKKMSQRDGMDDNKDGLHDT